MRKAYIPSVAELDAFCACATLGTTIRAAAALNLTQSAVSRSLRTLEDRLGVALFHRARQRLQLSDAGRAFLPDAEALLRDLGQAATRVMAFGGHRAVLRIAVLPSFGRAWLIPRLGAFLAQAPDVTFDIAARLQPVDFETGAFDLAIQRSQHRVGGDGVLHLMDETLVAVAAPALLAGRNGLSDADLLALPLLQQATRPALWLDWFRHGDLDARRILRGARFDHFDMVLDAAVAGLGVALVPEVLARRQLDGGALRRATPRRMASDESYTMIYPDRSAALPEFAAFRDWLMAQITQPDAGRSQ